MRITTDSPADRTAARPRDKSPGSSDFSKALGEKRKQGGVSQQNQTPNAAPALGGALGLAPTDPENVVELPPTLNVDQLATEIVDHMASHDLGGLKTVEIQFNSQTLNGLAVSISSDRGAVSVQFVTSTDAVASLLKAHFVDLRSALETRGVRVGRMGVVNRGGQFR